MPSSPPYVQSVDIGELPVQCTAVANALSAEPVQVTNYISDFQKITVSGLCADGDAAGAIAAATAYLSGYRIFGGTTCTIGRTPELHAAKSGALSTFTVTFNVLP